VVASVAYEPAYIAGWSAAEHRDLTGRSFRDVLVVTGRRPRDRHPVFGETTLVLHTVDPDSHLGLVPVWQGNHRIDVTDPSRTVVDLLAHPSWGGGIRQIGDMITEYFDGSHRNDELMLSYGDRLGNRSVFKRLGLLLEQLEIDAPGLIAESLRRRSAGISTLDPSVRARGRVESRWGLRVNVEVTPAGT
jgi:predicted transcriptional regulator of viral defense system